MKRSIVVAVAVSVLAVTLMLVGHRQFVADGNPLPPFPPKKVFLADGNPLPPFPPKSQSDVSSARLLLKDGNPLPSLMTADGNPLPPFPPTQQKPSAVA